MSYSIQKRAPQLQQHRSYGSPGSPAVPALPGYGQYNPAVQRQYQATPTHAPGGNVRPQYRSSHAPLGNSPAPASVPGPVAPLVYHHSSTYPSGDLGFFLPPPGQKTTDPSLSTVPTTQALYTTYPSRLRTGVTGLMQPEHVSGGPREREIFLADMEREFAAVGSGSGTVNGGRSTSGTSTPRYDSPAPYPRLGRPVLTGRRSRVVNYAEKASDDEISEHSSSDPDNSDVEEDYGGARRRRGAPRDSNVGSLVVGGVEHQTAMRMGKLRRKMEDMEKGWTWLGARTPGDRVRSRVVGPTKHVYVSEESLEGESNTPEMLVPITIDLDVTFPSPDQPGIKVRDRFLWNINEQFITPYQFALIFCDDVAIPHNPHAQTIAELIKAQIEEMHNAAEVDIRDEEVGEDDVVWNEEEEEEEVDPEILAQEAEARAEEEEKRRRAKKRRIEEREVDRKNWVESDCRIVVNLDVQIYSFILRDRIEWDLSSSLPPSIFAKQYCAELGLSGEAIPSITFAITEELLKHKKDALDLELFTSTHPTEQAKWENGAVPRVNTKYGARGLKGVWRDWWEREEFGPVLVELSMEEMERREVERTREARRVMRGLTGTKRRR